MVYNLSGIKEKRAHKKNENLEFKVFVRLNSTHFPMMRWLIFNGYLREITSLEARVKV